MDKIIASIIVVCGLIATFLIAIFVWALRFGIVAVALYIVYLIGKSLFFGG